jgi:hypothetical protein
VIFLIILHTVLHIFILWNYNLINKLGEMESENIKLFQSIPEATQHILIKNLLDINSISFKFNLKLSFGNKLKNVRSKNLYL